VSNYATRVEETVWIALPDGCRLAARIWFPVTNEPLPAILEYLPYRRRDRHRGDDAFTHPALAAEGYVCVRVDMRGSGDSDGVMFDEYTPQEWRDAVDVIGWIAAQPWCDGNVGMTGLSWSGFNSLQVAALAPAPLKAIVTTCASDDRFADDMHYMGGCLLNDNLQYGSTLFTWLATPPDPAIVGERWRDMWLARLDAVSPPALQWMRNGTRNGYWKSGSVCEDYSAIKAAVLAVGGWADGYTNAVMRLLSGLTGPRKGLIGPWGHAFPHVAMPGPGIDFIAYLKRWWDCWLKGRDDGIMSEPMLACWIQESEAPQPSFAVRKGRWAAESVWPPKDQDRFILHATDDGLRATVPVKLAPTRIDSPPQTGTASGEWCPYGWGPDMPLDQRAEDAVSACWDSASLDAPLTLLGGVTVELTLAVDAPEAMVAIRLNDVSADGVSRRITYGLRNLTLTDNLGDVRTLRSGEPVTVRVRLNDIGYEVPAGNRLRLAVSTAYWPLAVGAPARAPVTVLAAHVAMPLASNTDAAVPPSFGPAISLPYPEAREIVGPGRGRLSLTERLDRRETVVEVVRNLGAVELGDVSLTLRALGSETYTMPWQDPSFARSEARRLAAMRRPDWDVRVETRSRIAFDGPDYTFSAVIEAFENDGKIFERSWDERVARPGAAGLRAKDEEAATNKQQGCTL
jgi:putative CocE/NonD family hydrolase